MTINQTPDRTVARTVTRIGGVVLRLGLAIPLAWIGLQKFTKEEAMGIMPLIEHHPLMSWLYDLLSAQALSDGLGAVEIVASILIIIRPLSATASAVGSALATVLFLSTTSFLLTTPGVVAGSSLHVPLLTDTGGFLIKDIALLGAAIWTLGESLSAGGGVDTGDAALPRLDTKVR